MAQERSFANAGYAITGSGGGGNGDYVFASLDDLELIIREWVTIRDSVAADGDKIAQAQTVISPPAKDEMSTVQAAAMLESLANALEHNERMRSYAHDYVEKLTAVRDRYRGDDDANATRLRSLDVD